MFHKLLNIRKELLTMFGFSSINDLIMVGPSTTKIGYLLEDLVKNSNSINDLNKWNVDPITFRWIFGMQLCNTDLYKYLICSDNVAKNAQSLIDILNK